MHSIIFFNREYCCLWVWYCLSISFYLESIIFVMLSQNKEIYDARIKPIPASDTPLCFFSGWKHICTMYTDTFLRSFLKNVSYCLLVFVLWKFYAHVTNENWSSAQRKSLRDNKLWLWFFFFSMLEYNAHWLHGHKRVSKTIKFCLQIWFCSDTQECYKGA